MIKIPIPWVNSRVSERTTCILFKKPYTREMSMECYCLSFFFQSGVSLNRKQQQQLVCSDEVRLEFFYKNSLSWWVILDVRTKSKCSRFSEFNNKTFLSDTAWPFYSDVDLKSDFDSNAEPLNFQAKFIDYYSVIWSSFLGTVVHTTIMGS